MENWWCNWRSDASDTKSKSRGNRGIKKNKFCTTAISSTNLNLGTYKHHTLRIPSPENYLSNAVFVVVVVDFQKWPTNDRICSILSHEIINNIMNDFNIKFRLEKKSFFVTRVCPRVGRRDAPETARSLNFTTDQKIKRIPQQKINN